MATYYVRKNGSDAYSTAQAQNPATAWLTIDKAADNVAAGDTVYVGAGTYRETVTMDTSGSSGNQITFVGDVDGSQTGDAGLVVISAFTDSNTVTRASCWDPDGRTFITVRGFVMQGGSNASVYSTNTTDDNYEGVIFEDCVISSSPAEADYSIQIDFNAATTPTGSGLTIRRCMFINGGITVTWDGNETADQDLKITIENCVIVGTGSIGANNYGFRWDRVGTGTFGSGGVSVNNCTMIGLTRGVWADVGTSTTYTVDVRNCYIVADLCIEKATTNDGAVTSDYNTLLGDISNVTLGGNDRQETSSVGLGGLTDMLLYRFWGWSPYLPWEPLRPPGDDDWTSLIGDASATFAPATDFYNSPRPMHGTADDRGAVEGRARLEPETTTVRTGSTAGRFDGAGFHDMPFPVAAESTTVSVYARKDASYTGTAPQLSVLNIPGVADQTDTHTVAAGNWEELTVNFTPTAAGVARIRLISNDTSATGQCFFDDLSVS